MSKVLIILCLAIVTSMVSSQDERPPVTNTVSAATFVKNLITVESNLCSTEAEHAKDSILNISIKGKENRKKWYINTVKKMAYIWINKADRFLRMQDERTDIPASCLAIQQKLYDYGTRVGQNLQKCVASQQLIEQHFNQTFMANILPRYQELYNLKLRAEDCQWNANLGSTFTCLLQVMFDLFVLPNPKIAIHRQLYAAQTHADTLSQHLDNCPYLANMVEYEDRASQAVIQIADCLTNPRKYESLGE